MRRQYYGLIHAGIVGLLWSLPAQAQEMTWQQRDSEGMIFLAYEVPETSDQVLVLTCDTKSRQFALHYQDDRDRVHDGMKADVVFASEAGQKSLEMLAEKQELGDQVILRAETPLDAPMRAVLNGTQLRVTLSDATENIPLAAAQSGVTALAAGCGVD
ncbi:hypothetical protein F9K88_16705 [Brucella intermedia]|uniref:Invasion associated locus B family protein n=3 Tax=Brucella intermedia TaxID=94625 RepID=U4VAN6_9HYPH|nr:hypothetical protein [Brucella intermedia]ERM02088.1 hypothetical protein Q644_18340 [Brucella intermedia 229E]PJT25082.1 hypothetical protein CN884_09360 [Ochrobactrum sp. 30A/1000/2015]PJT40532.1 hypothetical protein CN883_03345 [Ochrobactrum sp. 27A/999/2015]PJT42831.1 hypothetical protein CN882_12705 [Ochrobactrum sp. 23A/997/2015]EEQ94500.1 Hypothetical protein OINT_2001730 [Brucella intermedia LMG 3301]